MMKTQIWIIMLVAAFALEAGAQEGTYYYGPNSRPVQTIDDAIMFKEVKRKSNKKFVLETHLLQGEKWVRSTKEKVKLQSNGNQRIYYYANSYFPKHFDRKMEQVRPNEYLFAETTLTTTIRTGNSSTYLPLTLEGVVTEYHPNGTLKSKSIYENNQLVSNENWLSNGTKYIDSIFYSVDVEPEYQMGDDFFKAFLIQKLTDSRLDLTQIEDEVVVGWVVTVDGRIDGALAMKGKSRELNELLVNTISELPGYWTPAVLDGKKVKYFMTIPLNFMNNEANFQNIEFSGGVMHYDRY